MSKQMRMICGNRNWIVVTGDDTPIPFRTALSPEPSSPVHSSSSIYELPDMDTQSEYSCNSSASSNGNTSPVEYRIVDHLVDLDPLDQSTGQQILLLDSKGMHYKREPAASSKPWMRIHAQMTYSVADEIRNITRIYLDDGVDPDLVRRFVHPLLNDPMVSVVYIGNKCGVYGFAASVFEPPTDIVLNKKQVQREIPQDYIFKQPPASHDNCLDFLAF